MKGAPLSSKLESTDIINLSSKSYQLERHSICELDGSNKCLGWIQGMIPVDQLYYSKGIVIHATICIVKLYMGTYRDYYEHKNRFC